MLTKHMILNIGVYCRGSPLSATAPPNVLCTLSCARALVQLPPSPLACPCASCFILLLKAPYGNSLQKCKYFYRNEIIVPIGVCRALRVLPSEETKSFHSLVAPVISTSEGKSIPPSAVATANTASPLFRPARFSSNSSIVAPELTDKRPSVDNMLPFIKCSTGIIHLSVTTSMSFTPMTYG